MVGRTSTGTGAGDGNRLLLGHRCAGTAGRGEWRTTQQFETCPCRGALLGYAMKTGLEHLPPQQQQEIGGIVRIVFEEFEDALSLASRDWKIKCKILKILPYGSTDRGDWVYEATPRVGQTPVWIPLNIVTNRRM